MNKILLSGVYYAACVGIHMKVTTLTYDQYRLKEFDITTDVTILLPEKVG